MARGTAGRDRRQAGEDAFDFSEIRSKLNLE
jgi:hypothetical protein